MDTSIHQRQQIINYGYMDVILGLPLAMFLIFPPLILLIGALRGTLDRIFDGFFFFVVLVFCLLVGYPGYRFLVLKGIKGIRLRNRVRSYLNLIVNQGKRSLDNIAADLKRSDIQKVMEEVQEVIELGFLPGMKLDQATRTIDAALSASRKDELATGQDNKKVSFSCKPCGANNTVSIPRRKTVAECEYCGCVTNI